MRRLAFIPARGGSKGIPRKNLVPLAGKPLLQYTIEAAMESRYLTDILFSSEDQEMNSFVSSLGLPVNYRRPPELASDEASLVDALLHALDWWKGAHGALPEQIMLLQPTSPLRTAADIDGAVEFMEKNGGSSLISVHRMTEHPYECVRQQENGWRFLASSGERLYRRQEYQEEFYFINGAIYLLTTDFFLERRNFFIEDESLLYIMDPAHGVDIDDLPGLERAEFYELQRNRSVRPLLRRQA